MTSASESPYWGRAWGRFSTLMASAGRWGTLPPGAGSPVRGQVATAGGAVVVAAVVGGEVPAGRDAAFVWPDPQAESRPAAARRPARARVKAAVLLPVSMRATLAEGTPRVGAPRRHAPGDA